MIRPANPLLVCFTIKVLRYDMWRKVCHPHAPGITYKFFTYNDADEWVRKWLDDFVYEITSETLVYNSHFDTWL